MLRKICLNSSNSIQLTAETFRRFSPDGCMRSPSIIYGPLLKGSPSIGGKRYSAVTDPKANTGKPWYRIVTISSMIPTVIVFFLTAVSSAADADAPPGGRTAENVWTENNQGMYVAGSGDNPWALPQTSREKPQGPAYQVNPHYVTPEDIRSDSLAETGRRGRKRGSSSTATPESNYRDSQQEPPYGLNYAPGYAPGYGGYYGGFPGMYGGAPGFGGNPLTYPYGGGTDLGDPYNLMMQPYTSVREGDGDSEGR